MLEFALTIAVFVPNYLLALYGAVEAFRGMRDEYPPLHKLHASVLAICVGYLVIQTRMLPTVGVITMDGLAVVALSAVTLWTLARFSREQRVNSARVMKQVAREVESGSHPTLPDTLDIADPSPTGFGFGAMLRWFRRSPRVDAKPTAR